jgi:hypothetical protein
MSSADEYDTLDQIGESRGALLSSQPKLTTPPWQAMAPLE